jgi:general secretion pathway protein A
LGLDPEGKSRYQLYSELNLFLIDELSKGNNVVMIIDEAQNLSIELLEQIRMLSNLETEKEKLLQIVLVGQPELRDKLNSASLRQLRQRIMVRYHLPPLSFDELDQYIKHRLSVAGLNAEKQSIFTKESLQLIQHYSGGIPRLINVLCDKAMLYAFVRETFTIGDDMIRESISEIEGLKR